MSRRYVYSPRMTAKELSDALNALDLSAGMLSKVSGASFRRIQNWLAGEDDIPVYVQRDLEIWQVDPTGLALALEWVNHHAQDVRQLDR